MPDLSKKFRVLLTPEMRSQFEAIVRKKSLGAARIRRATVLLRADEAHPDGGWHDWEIAEEVGLCERQIVRIRQKFVKSGPQSALVRAVRSDAGVRRTLDGAAEARLVTIACSEPPEGRDHWTLQMLCDELRRLKIVKSICCETLRQVLKKTNYDLGRSNVSVLPNRTARGSSRGWKKSSTSTRKRTMNAAR
jgi:hypothetical protein